MRIELEEESEEKHIVIKGYQELTYEHYIDYFKTRTTDKDSALLYIHGFNTSFEDAAKRTGQLVFDLNYQGIGMFYSWPSKGTLEAYTADTSNIQWTERNLASFLEQFKSVPGIKHLHIIAHSMGTRAITHALERRQKYSGRCKQTVSELPLAAPDIDEGIFKKNIAPIIPNFVKRTTIYRSWRRFGFKSIT